MTKPKNELLFLALGGSGEIGMNVNLYGCEGKWLMVDCGITFADPQYPGIDVILPDLQFIEERLDDLVGIVLTHGHEDHIGALPYLAEDLGVPLYATPFTAGLIRGKLEEEGNANRVKLRVIQPNAPFDLGPFGVTFVPMSHSIPEASALLIDTPYGRIFHTGDWKLDAAPVIGHPSSPAELAAIGEDGILALVCDSTNIFNNEASGSESDVFSGLMDVISKAKGRVMVTSFASNAARLHTLGKVAIETGRSLCVQGRSLDRILKVARATGYLKDFPETIDAEAAMRLPRDKVLVVATGGQGEERAALARVANGQHPIALASGDTVVFSSKQIPGNEVAIGRIQNQLAAKGVIMITDRQAHVHVSGHPGRPELLQMYRWMKPEILMPVHGEMRHLMEHARFGLSESIPRALVQTNGDIVRLAPGAPTKIGNAPVGRLVLDGDVILPGDGQTINERRKLALNGQISVAVAIGSRGLIGTPQVRIQGIPVEEDREPFLEETVSAVIAATKQGGRDRDKLREQIRLATRKVATRWTGKKPNVDVLLIEA
ncbi:ribonuclease J [Sphingomonas sp. AAP5]|uniref:MBL fold hydrolase n=1 Tax=Sphingomonas glacialis TaxID=658225 RepID=A0ABQ3LGQ2_9SPHN|nr:MULTISPECIES: ribonuclease J [Sphingomonas]MDY7525168.1 ribonuclease J [Sphingomonas sp. 10B4]MEB0283292.1 ribonuclease J [Sphingomonas sp. 10B4]QBM76022.1 ribonuclease J [Sphingomonas sp. AAP5]GHH10594.1 MBL fold hydrolase [Sphingomonas glacialis]